MIIQLAADGNWSVVGHTAHTTLGSIYDDLLRL
jgi:hypothetical protein